MKFQKGCSSITVKENLFLLSNVDKDGITIKINRLLNHHGHRKKIINLLIFAVR